MAGQSRRRNTDTARGFIASVAILLPPTTVRAMAVMSRPMQLRGQAAQPVTPGDSLLTERHGHEVGLCGAKRNDLTEKQLAYDSRPSL